MTDITQTDPCNVPLHHLLLSQKLRRELGKLHGRSSHRWNLESIPKETAQKIWNVYPITGMGEHWDDWKR